MAEIAASCAVTPMTIYRTSAPANPRPDPRPAIPGHQTRPSRSSLALTAAQIILDPGLCRIRTRWGGRGGLGIRLALRLDQDDDGLGQHAIGRHRLGRGVGPHKGPERVYIIHIGGERHMYRVIRVGVRADVVDAKGPEHLLPERRGQPVRAVLDIVVGDNPWHKASSVHASADRMPERAYPVGLRRK